ncbi:MAG: hypothetical protein PHU98_06260 [Mariniphaga sp.]|nr:hypothetical protein [Mariniphaga sp.]
MNQEKVKKTVIQLYELVTENEAPEPQPVNLSAEDKEGISQLFRVLFDQSGKYRRKDIIDLSEKLQLPDEFINELIIDNRPEQVNLFDLCKKHFETCISYPAFGTGVGKDNVVCCDSYVQI